MRNYRRLNDIIRGGVVGFTVLLLTGCVGLPTRSEKQAREDREFVESLYRPGGERPALPKLEADSTLGEFLHFAMLNQPQVEASYFDWVASVERITRERSLPDPRLMFSADIQDIVMALMPGLMMEIPWPGKLRAGAEVSSAEANSRYYAFVARVLEAAFAVKREYYSLQFLDEKIRVTDESLALVNDLEELARMQYQVGRVTYQDVLRAQIEQDQLVTEVENLEDSRGPLHARWKAALGMHGDEPDPPVPLQFESTPLEVNADQMLATALARNPQLLAMEAEVRQAESALLLARRSRMPDFSLGLEVDVEASPYMYRPQATMTLPVWRDKIAAEIAEAQARKRSAQSRLSAEQIELAVTFAERLFEFRESTRNLVLLQEQLLPKAQESFEVARSGYLSAQVGFFDLIDAERTLLEFQIREIEEQTRREVVAAELLLIVLGTPPDAAPLLPEEMEEGRRPAEERRSRGAIFSRGTAS